MKLMKLMKVIINILDNFDKKLRTTKKNKND